MPDLAPDTLVDGRYRILTRLGAGGMADVFCAEDQQLGRKVALKLLHRRFAEDTAFVERFRREASSAAGLQHPNVVGVYDRGEWDGTYYIAMEYLPGRTLKDVVRDEAPLDPLRAIDFTVQILKAARFAHRRGIVHRDLKPHNVLVDDEDRLKVTDFGIARAGASDMTETGSIMGTAQYLSPEQAQGQTVSPASDLYAVGVILFELLTGYVPFDADSTVSIALKHVSEAPPAPSTFDPSVPPELEAIVLWALEKDPARRPPDADAFIHALEGARDGILAGEGGPQPTTAFVPAPLPPTAETRVAPAPVAAYEEPPLPPRPVLVPAEPRQRAPWWAWLLGLLALAALIAGLLLLLSPGKAAVPGVVGQDLQTASAELRAAGFETDVERVRSARPLDEVIAQDPSAGTEATEGATVVLTVSGGPGTVDVPSVERLGERRARAVLANAGLDVGRVELEADDEVPERRVTRTSPPAGTSVDRGSSVTLFVSTGPEQITVPEVVGLGEEEAKQTLAGEGLTWEIVDEGSDEADPGTVLRQDPPAGSAVDPDAAVTLVVAREIPQVVVPDVRGQTAEEAVAALFDAGLEPRESTSPVGGPEQDGIVIAQRPAGGTTAAEGAPVRIFVGRLTGAPGAPDEEDD